MSLAESGQFFRPTDAFVSWLADQARSGSSQRIVIDAGCGYGQLTAALIRKGVGAIGIDLQADKIEDGMAAFPETAGRLIIGDVVREPFVRTPHAIVTFARPCHSPWIRAAIEQVHATARVIYISKPGKEEGDLDGLCYKRVAVDLGLLGEDGEIAWEVRKAGFRFSDLEQWFLVELRDGEITWVRGDPHQPDRWFWGAGLSWFSREGTRILEHAVVDDDFWLDHSRTTRWQRWNERVDDTTMLHGWVSPTGRWYRCGYHQHDRMAYEYLMSEVGDLEKGGWARVSCHADTDLWVIMVRDPRDTHKDGRLTTEQVTALLDGGAVVPDYMLEEAEGDWSRVVQRAAFDEGDDGDRR